VKIAQLIIAGTMLALACVGLAAADRAAPAIQPPAQPEDAPTQAFRWNSAEYVFTANLDKVDAGPVGMSFPPVYTHTLHFTVETVLRGPVKPGEKVVCSHVSRQENEPQFPLGKTCVVAANKAQDSLTAQHVEAADPVKVAMIKVACALPLGWTTEGEKPVSPWASLGKKAWAAEMAGVDGKTVLCSQTGRPALMAGDKVTFEVEPVPPKVAIQWTNPDGDGEYKITVTNPTDQPVKVPALLSAGGKILWEESLIILCQDKVYTCPGSQGVAGKVEPTTLAPKQSVSTVVSALRLKGPEWPQGGYRIEFQFCLGEKSKTQSLYYMSRHHDKLRDAAQQGQ
jgi:hypothetical protein